MFEGKPPHAERRPKAAKPKPANDNRPASIIGGVTNMPMGNHLVEIIEYVDCDPWATQTAVKLTLRPATGEEPFVHEAYFSHPIDEEWEAGRKSSRSLLYAIGGDPDAGIYPDPVGTHVWANVGKTVEYRAAMAPTKSAQSAAPNRSGA